MKLLRKLPHVHGALRRKCLPRILAFAQAYFRETSYHYQDQTFISFCRGYQHATAAELREFTVLSAGLKLVLLEEIAARGRKRRGLSRRPSRRKSAFAFRACGK